jgi:hypothetical protein
MKLWEIAHSRTGDKGNISNLSLIAYDIKDFELLKEKVTPEVVKEWFKDIVKGEVVRYELPQLGALNFDSAPTFWISTSDLHRRTSTPFWGRCPFFIHKSDTNNTPSRIGG